MHRWNVVYGIWKQKQILNFLDKDSVMVLYDRALSKINNTMNDQLWLLWYCLLEQSED